MKIIILIILAIFTILALNPQEFLAKRKDTETLKNISKFQITNPEKLYSRRNNANCLNGNTAWAFYEAETETVRIMCK